MEQIDITIILPEDCEDSPKVNFIKELNVQMAKQNMQFFYDHITEDITWNILAIKRIKGKKKVFKLMNSMGILPVIELKIESIITNGIVGTVNGVVTFVNHERYAYCSIYTFTSNSKQFIIKEKTTYFHKL